MNRHPIPERPGLGLRAGELQIVAFQERGSLHACQLPPPDPCGSDRSVHAPLPASTEASGESEIEGGRPCAGHPADRWILFTTGLPSAAISAC